MRIFRTVGDSKSAEILASVIRSLLSGINSFACFLFKTEYNFLQLPQPGSTSRPFLDEKLHLPFDIFTTHFLTSRSDLKTV